MLAGREKLKPSSLPLSSLSGCDASPFSPKEVENKSVVYISIYLYIISLSLYIYIYIDLDIYHGASRLKPSSLPLSTLSAWDMAPFSPTVEHKSVVYIYLYIYISRLSVEIHISRYLSRFTKASVVLICGSRQQVGS